jgi:glyoxylase-like metal-dependent hydrolase (beta-lactamase superfamily II)
MGNKEITIVPINYGMVYAYLLNSKGNYSIIDCGTPGTEIKTLKVISDLGLDKTNLRSIIITHGHSDHMGACSALKKATGAKTIIHKLDSDAVRKGENVEIIPASRMGRLLCHFDTEIKGFEPYEPEVIINREFPLYDFGIPGKIIETPGHTKGSISVLLDDGNLFIGDLIMGGMIDKGKPKLPMFACDLKLVKENIKKIVSLSPRMVYTGHGGPFTVEKIKKMYERNQLR